jgi:hypothetical protein
LIRRLALALMLIGAGLSCSRPATVGLEPIVAPDAESAWQELVRLRRNFPGAQSYARVRATQGTRKQSFTARLSIDSTGRTRIDGLTPIGTTAITLWTDGRDVVYLDHFNGIYWTGTVSQLSGPLRGLASGTPMLMIGLPASDARNGNVRYQLAPAGLAEAVVAGSPEITVTYSPPQFPPSRVDVIVGDSGDRLEIEHLELVEELEPVTKPAVDPDYRLAARPPSIVPPQ